MNAKSSWLGRIASAPSDAVVLEHIVQDAQIVDEPVLTIKLRGIGSDGVDAEFENAGEWTATQRALIVETLKRVGQRV